MSGALPVIYAHVKKKAAKKSVKLEGVCSKRYYVGPVSSILNKIP